MSIISELIEKVSNPSFFQDEDQENKESSGKEEIGAESEANLNIAFIKNFFDYYARYKKMCGDINEYDENQKTLLHHIANHGTPEILEELLKLSPNLGAKDSQGATAFHYAMANKESLQIYTILNKAYFAEKRKNKENPWLSLRDNNGYSPIFYSIHFGRVEIISKFLQSKEERQSVHGLIDNDGCNAIFIAAMKGQIEILRLLLQHGGNPYIETTENDISNRYLRKDNAITVAIRNKQIKASEFFINGGYAIGLDLPVQVIQMKLNLDYAIVIGTTIESNPIDQKENFALSILTPQVLTDFFKTLLLTKRDINRFYLVGDEERKKNIYSSSEKFVENLKKLLRFAFYMADQYDSNIDNIIHNKELQNEAFISKFFSIKNLPTIIKNKFSIHRRFKSLFNFGLQRNN